MSEITAPQISFKKRSAKSKANFRRKPDTPPPVSDSSFTSSDDEDGHKIKRRRKTAVVAASSISNTRRSESDDHPVGTTPAPLASTNDATKQSNWYDENELNEKNLLGKTRAQPATDTSSAADGTYKGTANYRSFIQKNPDAPTKQFGPIKAPTNVRTVTFMDYAPDVCKDYKLTGYCGFGDGCKFSHMREDYKQGWELDREWDSGTKGKQLNGRLMSQRGGAANDDENEDDDEETLENIPFACIICRKPYQNPIITKCGHYFCESCALQRYRKNPSCAACGAGTGGVFNVAKKLNQLLDKKRERARRRREQALADGEEVSSEDEEGGAESP